MKPVFFAFPDACFKAMSARDVSAAKGKFILRSFPDGESYLRVQTEVRGKTVVIGADLRGPDGKFLPFYFLASLLRNLGAKKIVGVIPYLPYLRQDKRFQKGEAVTSRDFARLLSQALDGLVTVDPHLHRYKSLQEVYSIPCRVVSAAPILSRWILAKVPRPFLIGPDSESEQWVKEVAAKAKAPYVVLEKIRKGDRKVEVSLPSVKKWRNRTPVIVDDIISTARTMIETVHQIRKAGMKAPVCLGVHAVFAENAYEELLASGPAKVVTCNTVGHLSNGMDVSRLLGASVTGLGL
ncbi:MAG: ribose-phosphate pyrophosphokinase [bacterium]